VATWYSTAASHAEGRGGREREAEYLTIREKTSEEAAGC